MTTESGRIERRKDFVLYAGVVCATVIGVSFALRLWRADLTVPFAYGGDSVLISSHFKTILETGWYLYQPLLSAPHGQEYFDWKIADNLGMLFGTIMRPFTHDFAVVHNLYYLLGFLLAGITAAWFLRLVGISRWLTLPLAVLFAIAPYHFYRGESHMWLASYFPIPLALGVVYKIMRGRPLWSRRARTADGRFAVPPVIWTIATLLLVSTVNSYYAIITVALIAFAGIVSLIRTRKIRAFFGAVAAACSIVAVLAIGLLPWLTYGWANGTNPSALIRQPVEAEVHALKLTQLLLPAPNHRFELFRTARSFYDQTYPFPTEQPALGIIGALGFVALGLCALYFIATFGKRQLAAPTETRAAVGTLAALMLLCFLFGTIGGFGTLISFLTSDLRGWNRISIFIAMLSLAGFGLLADAVIRRIVANKQQNAAHLRAVLSAVTAVAILGVGVWDQTGPNSVPDYRGVQAEFASDRSMVERITDAVGPDAMVMQLPYRAFPETADLATGITDSEQLKPYLHSSTLRWTSGGIKGRPNSEWMSAIENLSPSEVVDVAVAAGFTGIFVDRLALDAQGERLVSGIEAIVGPPSVQNASERKVFYSLDGMRSDVEARYSPEQLARIGVVATKPVNAVFLPRPDSYTVPQLLRNYRPHIALNNDRGESATIRATFTLNYAHAPSTVTLSLPDGTSRETTVPPGGREVTVEFVAPAGTSAIEIALPGDQGAQREGTARGLVLVSDLAIADMELAALLLPVDR